MKSIAFIVSLALSACLFLSIGATAQPVSNQSAYTPPLANDGARMELVSFLEEARNYTQNNGVDEALKAFSENMLNRLWRTCSA